MMVPGRQQGQNQPFSLSKTETNDHMVQKEKRKDWQPLLASTLHFTLSDLAAKRKWLLVLFLYLCIYLLQAKLNCCLQKKQKPEK